MSTNSTPTQIDFGLSPAAIALFHQQGFLGPFAAVSLPEMEAIRAHIDSQVLVRQGPSRTSLQSRHMDSKVVFDLASHTSLRATAWLLAKKPTRSFSPPKI